MFTLNFLIKGLDPTIGCLLSPEKGCVATNNVCFFQEDAHSPKMQLQKGIYGINE